MELWICGILFLLCAAGIGFLGAGMKGREKKTGYILAIAGLSALALLSAAYGILTLTLINAIA